MLNADDRRGRFPRGHDLVHGTFPIGQLLAVPVGIGENPARPHLIQHLLRGKPQQLPCAAIPDDEAQIGVDEVEAVVQAFEQIQVSENMAERAGFERFLRIGGARRALALHRIRSVRGQGRPLALDPARQRTHHVAVELRAGRGHQDLHDLVMGLGAAIHLVGAERIVCVSDGQNAGALVHVAADPPIGVGDAVVVAVRLPDNVQHFLVDPARLQHVDADVVVQRHQCLFVRVECAGLEEDVVRHADLADVVQQRSHFEQLQLPAFPPKVLRQTHGHHRDSPGMPHGGDVPEVQRRQKTAQHPLGDHTVERVRLRTVLHARFGPARQRHQTLQDSRGIHGMTAPDQLVRQKQIVGD